MLSFHPGPSFVWPRMRDFLTDAFDEGILALPHRSPQFSEYYELCVRYFQEKLNVPEGYALYFVSSATECWEITNTQLAARRSLYPVTPQGAFGNRWRDFALAQDGAEVITQVIETSADCPDAETLRTADLICLTQVETSDGSALPDVWLNEIRTAAPDAIIAVDATTSMAGLGLPWTAADVWFASVQKCFGLPAGLAVLICNERARRRAAGLPDRYNSLARLQANYEKRQTTHTPNVLAIYLLARSVAEAPPIVITDAQIRARAERLYAAFDAGGALRPIQKDVAMRAPTVLCLEASATAIHHAHTHALAQGYRLGTGYGSLKERTLRIANFPAIPDDAYDRLLRDFALT